MYFLCNFNRPGDSFRNLSSNIPAPTPADKAKMDSEVNFFKVNKEMFAFKILIYCIGKEL